MKMTHSHVLFRYPLFEFVHHSFSPGSTWHQKSEAIRFIEQSVYTTNPSPFTQPDGPQNSGHVAGLLRQGDCRETVDRLLTKPPPIPYVAPDAYSDDCRAYRQSVLDRASGTTRNRLLNKEMGTIWIDDAIGWILVTLDALDQLDDTFVLFQRDHGDKGKRAL